MIPLSELAEMKRYCDAATEGLWRVVNRGDGTCFVDIGFAEDSTKPDTSSMPPEDGEFIVGSRVDLPRVLDALIEVQARLVEVDAENAKLQAFKSFVHDRLDAAGVPHDPDPEHNKACSCRIGGRLNYVLGENANLRQALYLISILDQGAGGHLTFQEMAESAMRQASAALAAEQKGEL